MPINRRADCVPLPMIVCPVVAVGMLESRVARCVHCVENVAWLHTVHTSCHPTLQHHNSYNRTNNYRQWNAVGSPGDGHKDARNMLRYYWLPINHYLLHLVGFPFTYLSKMHGHSNIKCFWAFCIMYYVISNCLKKCCIYFYFRFVPYVFNTARKYLLHLQKNGSEYRDSIYSSIIRLFWI